MRLYGLAVMAAMARLLASTLADVNCPGLCVDYGKDFWGYAKCPGYTFTNPSGYCKSSSTTSNAGCCCECPNQSPPEEKERCLVRFLSAKEFRREAWDEYGVCKPVFDRPGPYKDFRYMKSTMAECVQIAERIARNHKNSLKYLDAKYYDKVKGFVARVQVFPGMVKYEDKKLWEECGEIVGNKGENEQIRCFMRKGWYCIGTGEYDSQFGDPFKSWSVDGYVTEEEEIDGFEAMEELK